jgi:hypothetical protein
MRVGKGSWCARSVAIGRMEVSFEDNKTERIFNCVSTPGNFPLQAGKAFFVLGISNFFLGYEDLFVWVFFGFVFCCYCFF